MNKSVCQKQNVVQDNYRLIFLSFHRQSLRDVIKGALQFNKKNKISKKESLIPILKMDTVFVETTSVKTAKMFMKEFKKNKELRKTFNIVQGPIKI